jgi:hypothetical protein
MSPSLPPKGLGRAAGESGPRCLIIRVVKDLLPGNDGFAERKTWDRASIALISRKPYVPKISRRDLLLPSGADKLRTFGLCAICGFALSILYVGIPLLILGIFVSLGRWDAIVLGAVFPALTVIVFVAATHESRQLKQLAREL